MHKKFPVYDDNGINLADPHDHLGLKTSYISIVQKKALLEYLENINGNALDIGCGYGRMAAVLNELGLHVTGVEPSLRVLETAKELYPQNRWLSGQLPELPVEEKSFDLVCLFNVTRVLHLMNQTDIAISAANYLSQKGKLVIIDNIKKNDRNYISEDWFENSFKKHNLRLTHKIPIRSSRWPLIYLIRYGLIPEKYFEKIASWELKRMKNKTKIPRFSYYNYLFIYEKIS